jgi:riboflavin-specific deaminase-like protein
MYPFEAWLSQAYSHLQNTGHPLISLCYAQSLDGSLSDQPGRPYALSGPQTLHLTHHLRSLHEAILVGVGTILSDDPRLNVRLTSGKHPRPMVLDSNLRTPVDARLFQSAERSPWFFTTEAASHERRVALQAAGAEIINLPADAHGKISLPDLLTCLGERSIASLMVEGGARVLQAFLKQQLVDQVIITLAPLFLGGVPVIEPLKGVLQTPFRLAELGSQQLGEDLVVWGRLPSQASHNG